MTREQLLLCDKPIGPVSRVRSVFSVEPYHNVWATVRGPISTIVTEQVCTLLANRIHREYLRISR